MSLESEIFKRARVNKNKLLKYGFIKSNNVYIYEKNIHNNDFKVIVYIDKDVKGKIIDLVTEEEYTNFRREDLGIFSSVIKEEYIDILKDILVKCFESNYFIYNQTNRITKKIKDKYGADPEFMWDDLPGCGVFRNKSNNKWFGIIMNIDKSKIIKEENGEIEVLNVKLDDVNSYLNKDGIYEAYHMNKKHWVSIILDEALSDEYIMSLIDLSYEIVK